MKNDEPDHEAETKEEEGDGTNFFDYHEDIIKDDLEDEQQGDDDEGKK